jgi:hypothetical protein
VEKAAWFPCTTPAWGATALSALVLPRLAIQRFLFFISTDNAGLPITCQGNARQEHDSNREKSVEGCPRTAISSDSETPFSL